jgi:hypothetical protein
MSVPTRCPNCRYKLHPTSSEITHPSSLEYMCENNFCTPLGMGINSYFFISVADAGCRVDGWGIQLCHNDKWYYLQSIEDFYWAKDSEDLPADEIVMTPNTSVSYIEYSGDPTVFPSVFPMSHDDIPIIQVEKFFPYPMPNTKRGCIKILKRLLNLVPYT